MPPHGSADEAHRRRPAVSLREECTKGGSDRQECLIELVDDSPQTLRR